ncbi:unnamed protein product [Orchesella dallaii]|uniref:WASH1 WAHD domain-containing protein n=1 Tax=Orchesella dallaii TaxID=48710 RepID=A0ABP1PNK4_9HEXA
MIVEGGRKYGVRLIPQTCNREDAIREIVGALDHLNAISDEIFSTVRTRLSSHRQQIESLSSRVSAAAQQVSAIKGTQNAIRIISSAKYPCEKSFPVGTSQVLGHVAFPALVTKHIPDPPVLGHDIEEDEEIRCQKPLRIDTPIKHPNDLLSIFHVREPNLGDLSQLDNAIDVGLGRPPSTIQNMDSFFLFNTVDNPYVNYKMTERSLQDRNFGTLKPTRKGEEVQAEVCPTTSKMNESGLEKKTEVDDFYYNPSALEIPNIDVPEHLPDLPGIAENLYLTDEPLSPLYPCPPKSLSFSNLSSQNSTSSQQQPSPFTPDKAGFFHTSTPEEPPKSFPTIPSIFSPPPMETVKSTVAATTSPPPPPPPPPPIMTMEAPKAETPKKAPSSSSGGDVRSSLMAAIREAGGSGKARLKSAMDKKYEAKKKKQDEKEKNIANELEDGGDLMSDLKNKLAMRRKGISGMQDGQKRVAGVGDIMLSLAATIPTLDSSSAESAAGPAAGSDDDDWD